ncbi:MAG: hypothetical protein NTZ55_04375 [Candidatus Roizmanbacteria bacterium]|nr:hypothetical protein [Candidatus Roizmanbacteria bacterium]
MSESGNQFPEFIKPAPTPVKHTTVVEHQDQLPRGEVGPKVRTIETTTYNAPPTSKKK